LNNDFFKENDLRKVVSIELLISKIFRMKFKKYQKADRGFSISDASNKFVKT